MAFKSKKWVKPGTVIPDNRSSNTENSDSASTSFSSHSVSAAPRYVQPVSRKWVKPGLAQAIAPPSVTTSDHCGSTSQSPQPFSESAAACKPSTLSVQPAEAYQTAEVIPPGAYCTPTDSSHTQLFNNADSSQQCQNPENDTAAGGDEAAAAPPPPPPSYWKVVRAEAEAKAAAEGDDPASATTPAAGPVRRLPSPPAGASRAAAKTPFPR